ncbi:HAD family hydrolase [soil metagenome]
MSDVLIFDCDGVLSDTERDGHLPSFNAAFRHFGLPVEWNQDDYGRLLAIGGGKERLATLFTPELIRGAGLPTDPEAQRELILAWHREKTAHYTGMIRAGQLPARPGIARISAEALDAGWGLAVASTSAEESVRAVLEHAVGPELAREFAVFAGDAVALKKPAPDIYLLALSELSATRDDVVVIEDSRNGLQAALAAELVTVVTQSSYTTGEDFTGAALVVDTLGDRPEHPTCVVVNPFEVSVGPDICLDDLVALRSAALNSIPTTSR